MKMMFRCMVAGLPLLLSAAVVEEVQVPSPAMNKDVPASVVLPAKYAQDPGAAWPVVYVVHGAGGNHRTYATASPTSMDSSSSAPTAGRRAGGSTRPLIQPINTRRT